MTPLGREARMHHLRDHGVRLPEAIESYVLARMARWEDPVVSADWWVAGAEPGDEPLERLVWGGNTQLVQQPGRRIPGLDVQGDTLSLHVDGPRSARLLRGYEQTMRAVGWDGLPYAPGAPRDS